VVKRKELAAQIRTLHTRILPERLGFVLQNDFARFEHITIFGNFQRAIRILFHQQNRDAMLLIDFDNLSKIVLTSNGAIPEKAHPASGIWFAHQRPSIANICCSLRTTSPRSAFRVP